MRYLTQLLDRVLERELSVAVVFQAVFCARSVGTVRIVKRLGPLSMAPGNTPETVIPRGFISICSAMLKPLNANLVPE
jgi:hypothetical protein